MIKVSIGKKIFTKFVSVVVAVAIILGVAPTFGIFNLLINASAEEPQYDLNLGSFTTSTNSKGNTVLTATPNANAGFRGWFLKDGTEVSYNHSVTLPTGALVSDYVPVFYNFNLVKNAGFEEYEVNTSLKSGVSEEEIWEGFCEDEIQTPPKKDWTDAKVVNDRAHTGSKSLRLTSQSNATYHDFYNLEPDTQYTVKFWYNLNPNKAASGNDSASVNYLQSVAVIGENTEMTILANSADDEFLARKLFNSTTGACTSENDWREISLTFYTGDNTAARLLLLYKSYKAVDNQASADSPYMYIDDISLVKDVMAEPSYFNEEFEAGVANWKPLNEKKLTAALDNGRLKVQSVLTYGYLQSSAVKVKKGSKYNISFDLDWSQVTDEYVPQIKNDKPVTDSDGNYVWEVNSSTGKKNENWINFALSNVKGDAKALYYSQPENIYDSTFVWTVTDANGRKYVANFGKGASSTGFGRYTSLKNLDSSKNLKINISFTAHETATIYFNSCLNGFGTYYLDNFVVTEDTSTTDYADIIVANGVKTKGTAIRTEGKQGMRYKTMIDKSLLTADMPYGVRVIEYGTIAIKSEYLGDSELVLDGDYSYNGAVYNTKKGVAYSYFDKKDLVFAEDKTTLDFTGVLTNIAEKNWNEDYTVRAYLKYVDKNGETNTIYVKPDDIAVYPVSKLAYSARNKDGNFIENPKVRSYLFNNIISKYTDKTVKIFNKSTPIATNFEGIRSTVYHGVTFFPDSHGRTYTEAQAAVEMDRLVDSKVDNVRTRFSSGWMWTNNGWDWNSEKVIAFCKWAKMLEERDISITIQAGWHLYDFICFYNKKFSTGINDAKDPDGDGHSSIPEVDYLHGSGTAFYNEDSKAKNIEADARALGLNLTDNEFAHYSVAAARYGEWIKQGVLALKSHGITNVEYIIPFTESGDVKTGDATYSYDEWIIMAMGLNNALKDAGIRSDYKLIGPAQSIYANQNRLSLLEYVYSCINGTAYSDMIDINAMHQYTRPNYEAGYENTVYDPEASYSLAEENFTYYNNILKSVGVRDMEFWCDEYFAKAADVQCWDGIGMQMTQFAAGITAGINNGVNRFLSWQMFDTLWDGESVQGSALATNSGEFSGGVHTVGTCPSLVHVDGKVCPNGVSCPCTQNYNISSYVPRTTYYGINLIGKYMNNENADVFATEVINKDADEDTGVYVSAIKNDDGKTVILVVNTMPMTSSVEINFESKASMRFDRYVYNPNETECTAEAKSISGDKTIVINNSNSFYDVIPAQSFAIYVEGGSFIGDDVDMPF